MDETLAHVAFVIGVLGFICFSISIPIVINYFADRRAHEGVDWFRRRRILRQGQSAPATVLSSTLLVNVNIGSKYQGAYSIVYDVRPSNGAPFRKRGVEVLYYSEADANHLAPGGNVHVRFDPTDQTVVLVRVDRDRVKKDRDAERRAKEDELLRGG